MADRNISDLPQLAAFDDASNLVVEQLGVAHRLTGALLKAYAIAAAKQGITQYPIAKDGTWWVWNGKEYEDTGSPSKEKGEKGDAGRGITSLSFTGGSTQPGTTAQYTFTFTDGETFTFYIRNGNNGKTPVRGTDYWTDEDKQEIVDAVMAKLTATVDGNVLRLSKEG